MNSKFDASEPGISVPETPLRELAERDADTAQRVVRLSSQALMDGAQEVEIEHNGALYRLRQTSLGKLILTK